MGKQKTVIMEGDIIKKPGEEKSSPVKDMEDKEKKKKKIQKEGKKGKEGKEKKKKKEEKEKELKVKKKTIKKPEKKEKKEKKKITLKIKERSKNYKQSQELIEKNKLYSIDEAIDLLKKLPKGNFDPSIEIHIKLGIDLSQSDQKVRTQITFPHDIGKTKKILVFAQDQKAKEAKKAGADFVGEDELVKKVEKGFSGFDVVISTPDMMGKIGKLGKYLGQKGLMPNPKSGTITNEIGKLVSEIKKGKTEIKSDDYGIIHQIIGKLSKDDKKLKENFKTLMDAIMSCKPAKTKGEYIQSITLCSTHSPGIKIHWP